MKILLPIEVEEAVLMDEKGKIIKGITGITTFKNGICVMTKDALYTNVKSLLKLNRNERYKENKNKQI